MAGSCGADTTANEVLESLLEGNDFDIPDVDLSGPEYNIPDLTGGIYLPLPALTNDNLTTRTVGGSGTFDYIMKSVAAHLKAEYEASRITGDQYTKAYIELTSASIGNAVSFLLGKDQAYWQAILAQEQAKLAAISVVEARVKLVTAKVQLAMVQYQALTAEADYGLTKIKIASEDANYCLLLAQKEQLQYTIDQIMPLQREGMVQDNELKDYNLTQIMPLQKAGLTTDNSIKTFNLSQMLPSQKDLIDKQIAGVVADTAQKTYTTANILPAQRSLVLEQVEVQRAQTLNTRTDGQVVVGQVGKQKDLYSQQIISYQRDAETKAAKIFSDAWITQKTIDEGLTAPNGFTNASVDTVLTRLKVNNGLT